jgi:nucleoside 2-deoxyribosyltransferase
MERLERRLKEAGVECQTSKRTNGRGILGCLKKIDAADIVYVVDPEGYVGKSVSVDIGYAYAKNKSLYAMYQVDDPPVMDLIDGILAPEELVDFIKQLETETRAGNI